MTRMAAPIYFVTMLLPVVAMSAPKNGVCGIVDYKRRRFETETED